MGRRNVLPEARSFTMAPSPFSCRSKSSTSFHIDGDRKSTRLNSSHSQISYAVFCLKKKKKISFLRQNNLIKEHTYQKIMCDYCYAMMMISEKPELFELQLELFNRTQLSLLL